MICGDDEQWNRYKCPVMLGQVVTVSGLDSEERFEVKSLVESEGKSNNANVKLNFCKKCRNILKINQKSLD